MSDSDPSQFANSPPEPSAEGGANAPKLPPRPQDQTAGEATKLQQAATASQTPPSSFAPPPKRESITGATFGGDNPDDPTHYTRDPHKLIGYLVPFPKPAFQDRSATENVPSRFLIYTPPPPPIGAPAEGEKEGKVHKVQRKWQAEVRSAKTSDAKVASWKGVKSRVTKGIDWAMGQTKTSSLEFLNRIPGSSSQEHDAHADDGHDEGQETHKTVGLDEMILVYPENVTGSQEQIREEFVNSMLRSKTKAQRDAIIATGLIPVSAAIDILATLIWPFGGLLEVDTVWAAANIRGAKTARSVTKRLNSSTADGGSESNPTKSTGTLSSLTGKMTSMVGASKPPADANESQLRLTFIPSSRTAVLSKYLAGYCHQRDGKLFQSAGVLPTETDIISAIGWSPSQTGNETKNWEDEQWELQEVKDDIRNVMQKGSREWDKWCKAYEKSPEKALKK